jgi:hypothetical protein
MHSFLSAAYMHIRMLCVSTTIHQPTHIAMNMEPVCTIETSAPHGAEVFEVELWICKLIRVD